MINIDTLTLGTTLYGYNTGQVFKGLVGFISKEWIRVGERSFEPDELFYTLEAVTQEVSKSLMAEIANWERMIIENQRTLSQLTQIIKEQVGE